MPSVMAKQIHSGLTVMYLRPPEAYFRRGGETLSIVMDITSMPIPNVRSVDEMSLFSLILAEVELIFPRL
jgi:hypothetical protein